MKKCRKLLMLVICLGVLLIASISVTFAYFININNKNYDVNLDINNETTLNVSSFEDLYKISINEKYNDPSNISSSRKVIRFSNDIVFESNIEIKIDAHIDINGKKLFLNGYELSISHGYYGTFNIENGTVYPYDFLTSSKKGVINITLPNATVLTNSLTFKDNHENDISLSSASFINITEIDFDYLSYSAFYFVNNLIKNDVERYNDKLSYEELKELSSYDSSIFKNETYNSLSKTTESYYYLSYDLELIPFYISKDIELTYSFSKEGVISPSGKISIPATYEKIVMSVKVSSKKLNKEKTIDFNLYAVNTNVQEIKNAVGLDIIMSYIEPYYHAESVALGNGETHDSYYLLDTAIELPKRSIDFDIDYSFAPYKDKACTLPVSTNSVDSSYSYLFEPNDECYYLKICYGNEKEIIINIYSTFITSFESACREIVNTLYGGSFVYDSSSNTHKLYSWNEINNDSRFTDIIRVFNITDVSYSFKPSSFASFDYEILQSGNDLSLTLAKEKPENNKEEALRVTFTFSGGITQIIDIYIIYIRSGGETINSFLTYYSIFAKQIPLQPTLEKFDLPLSYNDGSPYISYDFASSFTESVIDGVTYYNDVTLSKLPSIIVSLVDGEDNVLHTFSYQDGVSITNEFDEYLENNGYVTNNTPNVNELIKAYPNVKWRISFDKQRIEYEDVKVLLIYNYKFSGAGDWVQFNKIDENDENIKLLTDATTSLFEVQGGLYFDDTSTKENSIRDRSLFIYLYNLLNTDGILVDDSSDLQTYAILNSWLSSIDEFDVNASSLTGVTSWNGIQFFSKCRVLDFSNININDINITIDSTSYTLMDLVSKLNNLKELRLYNSSIVYNHNDNYETNNVLKNIIKLSNTLETLDVSSNNIAKFDWINSLDKIEKIYLYYNVSTNSNVSSYYGSLGICNFQIYEDLIRKGIAVYYDINANGVPVLFEESTDLNDYTILKGLVYQNTLKNGVSIVTIYESFKLIPVGSSGFGLSNQSGTLTWNHEGEENTSNVFYVVYSFTSNGNTINLLVKYYVDRY